MKYGRGVKSKLLLILAGLFIATKTSAFEHFKIVIKDPVVNPGLVDNGFFSDEAIEIFFKIGACPNREGEIICEINQRLVNGVMAVEPNLTDKPVKQSLTHTILLNFLMVDSLEAQHPDLGIYFRINGLGDKPFYSKTGLLHECIRKVFSNEETGNSCKPIRASAGGISIEISVEKINEH